MASRRRSERGGGANLIWPGFVDAMTALLLVLMFVLSIFMIVQFILREEITGRDRSLAALTSQLSLLTGQLSAAEDQAEAFRADIDALERRLVAEQAQVDALSGALNERNLENEALTQDLQTRIAELATATALLEQRDAEVSDLQAVAQALASERDAATLALETLESQSAEAETVAAENAELQDTLAAVRARLAAAEDDAQSTELTLTERISALELALQAKTDEALETLELLAAAERAQAELTVEARAAAEALTREQRAAAFAQSVMDGQQALASGERRAVALLNTQVAILRDQIAALNDELDAAQQRDADNQITIENLGARLNQALAQKVGELQQYRSEFFGRLRTVLGDRDEIRIVGDRFVFQSEVLFASGSADLGEAGKRELARFAAVLREIAAAIPEEVNWILRVDGHTDVVPLGPSSPFSGNWQLSQARALSVVEFLVEDQSVPAQRLAATGFGEYQPLDAGRSAEALARNRRIELKLTER